MASTVASSDTIAKIRIITVLKSNEETIACVNDLN